MDDPYHEVKSEVESSLQQLSSLLQSYTRLQSLSQSTSAQSSEQLSYTQSEILAILTSLQNDVDELEEALLLIQEDSGMARRLGISDGVLRERRGFVERVKGEIKLARKQLPREERTSSRIPPTRSAYSGNPLSAPQGRYQDDYDEDEDEDDDPNADFEMQHQSLLVEQQDKTLTSIAGTVEQLRSQARTIGTEVFDQNIMLDELDHQVDSTGSRLERAQRRMDRFIKANKDSPSSWLVFILIIILSILLFIILFL